MALQIKRGLFSCLLFINFCVFGQDQKVADSLKRIYYADTVKGTAKLQLLRSISFNEVNDLNLSLRFAEELIALATSLSDELYLSRGYLQKGNKQRLLGNFDQALAAYFKGAEAARKAKAVEDESSLYGAIADVYSLLDNHTSAMSYYNKAIDALRPFGNSMRLASAILNTGDEYRNNKNYDSALLYGNEAKMLFEKLNYKPGIAYAIGNIGMVYGSTGKNELAEKNINEAIIMLEALGDYSPICEYLISMCEIYFDEGDAQTSLDYAKRSLQLAQKYKLKEQISSGNLKLSELYEKAGKWETALNYYKTHINYRDSLFSIKTEREMNKLQRDFENSERDRRVDLLIQKQKLERIILYVALIVLSIIIVLVIVLFKNNRQKQRAFTLLSKEKKVTEEQRDQTNKALQELKRAQAHLIQSEKMASLGELTAGIAHEIQNPLNFVNNFSEVNTELINELLEENKKGNHDSVHTISEEILKNEEKINHHGRRADAIVRGMLEHSRAGTPEKRLININALADEYARLSYLGLRAKDKSFTANLLTDFDPHIGKINIVPQEIGRVILNLVNNAFHAVAAKAKETTNDYIPTVTVSTKKTGEQLLISVKDNGTGIPDSVKEKIFQPFFTTKAPGLGTGLGLSLSYDIVKGHGGEIKVNSSADVGSEFIVILPIDRTGV